jgi:hypothetical protein
VLFSPIIFDWIGDRLSAWVQGGVITGWLITMVSTLLLGKGESSNGSDEKKTPVLNLDNAALVVFLGLLFGAAWIVRFMLTPEGYSPQGNDPLLLTTLNGELSRLVPLLARVRWPDLRQCCTGLACRSQ